MGQRFLRWRVVDACETISYVGELCIISNILSVLAPHLFYFILFLDPLCMYTSFCLPLFSNLFVSLFSIFPPRLFLFPLFFHSFIHFIPRSRLPSTFARFLSTPVSPPSIAAHFRNFDKFQFRVTRGWISSRCIFFVIFFFFLYTVPLLYKIITL